MTEYSTEVDSGLSLEIYARLKNIAKALMGREIASTLTATGLVHEWYLKSSKASQRVGKSMAPITETLQFRFAARAMRQILIDRSRARITRNKLESKVAHDMSDNAKLRGINEADQFVYALEDAIQLMQDSMPENARLVRLRLLEGKSIDEAAEQLGMARATAFRKWSFCKVWLQSRLQITS